MTLPIDRSLGLQLQVLPRSDVKRHMPSRLIGDHETYQVSPLNYNIQSISGPPNDWHAVFTITAELRLWFLSVKAAESRCLR